MTAGFSSRVTGFRLKDLSRFVQLKTCENPRGTHALAVHENKITIATPHIQAGSVQMTHYEDGKIRNEFSIVISAHQNAITNLALNRDGSNLATMSEQGTLIRLFNPKTGDKVHELRRGSEAAAI